QAFGRPRQFQGSSWNGGSGAGGRSEKGSYPSSSSVAGRMNASRASVSACVLPLRVRAFPSASCGRALACGGSGVVTGRTR
ncbi:MAG TPA: hypothetical protein K8V16_06430, partial [Rubneribacter badeniensis]|nr:hypothetical protein [Rubneribacter badeniensis]